MSFRHALVLPEAEWAKAIWPDKLVCMDCGKECHTIEMVYTGDEESFHGFEMWCYCEPCNVETFHKIHTKSS